jgi:hypothetical protein
MTDQPVGYVALVSVPEERRTDALDPSSTWQAASAVSSDRAAIEGRISDLRRRKQPSPPATYALGAVTLADETVLPW